MALEMPRGSDKWQELKNKMPFTVSNMTEDRRLERICRKKRYAQNYGRQKCNSTHAGRVWRSCCHRLTSLIIIIIHSLWKKPLKLDFLWMFVFFPADFFKSPGEYPLINLSTINIHWCSEKVGNAAGATVLKELTFCFKGRKNLLNIPEKKESVPNCWRRKKSSL